MTDLPSWQLWPPNCCETCESWGRPDPYNQHQAICQHPTSVFSNDYTDSRFRCENFKRKADANNQNPQATGA